MGERPMPDRSAAADRLEFWIRRHGVQSYCGTHPAQNKSKLNPGRDLVGLSAIGKSLKDQYDALAPPMPPHLAALVEQFKTQR